MGFFGPNMCVPRILSLFFPDPDREGGHREKRVCQEPHLIQLALDA